MFEITPSFKVAVASGNTVITDHRDRFVPLLQRIIEKLQVKDEKPFSEAEESQLQRLLALSPQQLEQLIAMCTYCFQQAVYNSYSPQLSAAGANQYQVKAFQHVWAESGTQVLKAVRDQSFGAVPSVSGVSWRVQLRNLNTSTAVEESLQPEPIGVIQLNMSPPDTSSVDQGGGLVMEFSKDEMYDLFFKLERVQEQLDALA
ncbi:hypothetical protein CYMTET_53419 [Cymbomonas tetramitiformis]|uniref:COMM domain-containing protein n=1 Tax=Cymbomonas tetramitiformis TaxID=36881 RepID=A0AAE0EQ34_9CHLO|nr:hypothetical protein CYMTET_53419 [Cymbomonas tetramitiformis]